jgi:hypothetical protein
MSLEEKDTDNNEEIIKNRNKHDLMINSSVFLNYIKCNILDLPMMCGHILGESIYNIYIYIFLFILFMYCIFIYMYVYIYTSI